MKRPSTTFCAIFAAVAGVAVFAAPARAQYQIRNDGRASDASNQIGSNGYNGQLYNPANNGNQIRNNVNTGNNIVTGNVTGGQAFRGNVPYRSPYDLSIVTPGATVDRFIRDSYGVPQPYSRAGTNQQWTPQPFYGQTQVAAPPPGFERSYNSGYMAAKPMAPRQPGDLRLGQPLGTPDVTLPPLGMSSGPGQVNPSTQQPNMLIASPLYGLREQSMDFTNESVTSQDLGGLTPGRTRLDEPALQRMRDELRRNVVTDENAIAPGQPGYQNQNQNQNQNPDQSQNQTPAPGSTPGAAVSNGALPPGALDNKAFSSQLDSGQITSDVGTGQSLRPKLLVPAAVEQSAQYAALQQRLQEYNKAHPQLSDADAQRQYDEQKRTQEAVSAAKQTEGAPAAAPTAGAAPKTGSTVVTGTGPDYAKESKEALARSAKGESPMKAVAEANQKNAIKTAPIKIKSFAEGIKAKGLADILASAEDLMRQGKFSSAIDQYDQAEQIAPNNPLIWLGRANAELGASYYSRAESHLRQAFTTDPSLLMAQYDLKGFIGADRLAFLTKDLKEIATAEQDQPRPVFLLAYIAYNTGEELKAGGYLDLAEKRMGGKDPVLTLLRDHWTLPLDNKNAPKTDMNK